MLDRTAAQDRPVPAGLAEAPAAGSGMGPGAAIAGLASLLPERVMANAEVAERISVEPEWIRERTGVRERRIAAPGEGVVELAAAVSRMALADAGMGPAGIDLVLVATMSHDRLTPNAAPLVATEIGAEGSGAIDIGAACTGFVAALALAAGQIESGRADSVLVAGAEVLSELTDRDDRGTAALFGDGAGAAVLTGTERAAIGPALLGSDGLRAGLITATRREGVIRMQGQDTYRQAVARMSEATARLLEASELAVGDVDLFVFHQANRRIVHAVGRRLGLPQDRVVDCIERIGNTSAASIPLGLEAARREGRLRPGCRVLVCAFGGGLTWGGAVLEWGAGHDG